MDYESKGPTPTLLRNAGFVIGQYMDSLEARGRECEIEYGTARKVRDALYDCARHLESKSEDLLSRARLSLCNYAADLRGDARRIGPPEIEIGVVERLISDIEATAPATEYQSKDPDASDDLGLRHGRVHLDPGRSRAAKTVRSTEHQSVDQARPYFRLAGHLDDAIREGRRDDARALAVSIARLLGAEIPAAIECKSEDQGAGDR